MVDLGDFVLLEHLVPALVATVVSTLDKQHAVRPVLDRDFDVDVSGVTGVGGPVRGLGAGR